VRTHKSLRLFLLTLLAFSVVAAWPTVAAAQRRGGGGRVIIVGRYYSPFYDPWYQYGPYGPYGYPPYGYPPYGYYGRVDQLTSSIRLEVTPRAAEVYVDGYRAGVVDDYDGFLQRLHVRPGEHEVVLYLDGYRTVRQQLYLNPGSDQKIRYTMVPLPAGERAEPRPEPAPEEAVQPEPAPMPAGRRGGLPQGPRPGGPARGTPPQAAQNSTFGSVSIRVQPADADVMIDGERWTAPASADRLVVQLAEGRHHVDVSKDGFEKYSGDVQIRRGETATLNISLLRRSESR
jgi:hypothetical protein